MATLKLALIGEAGAGKDFLGTSLLYISSEIMEYSHARALYEIAEEYFGMARKDRQLLQNLGNKLREIDRDVLIKYIEKHRFNRFGSDRHKSPTTFEILKKGIGKIEVITDCRLPEEYEYWVKKCGFYPIKVIASKKTRMDRLKVRDGDMQANALEHELESHFNSMYGFRIINDIECSQRDLAIRVADTLIRLVTYKPTDPLELGKDLVI